MKTRLLLITITAALAGCTFISCNTARSRVETGLFDSVPELRNYFRAEMEKGGDES